MALRLLIASVWLLRRCWEYPAHGVLCFHCPVFPCWRRWRLLPAPQITPNCLEFWCWLSLKSCFLYSLFLSSFQVSGKAVQRETVLLVTSFPLFQIRSGWSGNLEVYEGHTLIGQPYILSIFFNIETITSKTNFLVLLISTFCFSNSVNKFKYVFCQVSKIKIFPVLALILDS